MKEAIETSLNDATIKPKSDDTEKNNIKSLLTVQEVATLLRVRPDTVRRWSDQGILKAYRLGTRGDRRFEKSEIMGDLLTVQEVATLLAVHPNTVRRWSDQGMLKSYRLGRRGDRRFPKANIMETLARILG